MRYCKDIVHLLFWKLWECLTIPIKIIVWICSNLLYLSACKKVPFITHFFLKILQRNSKLVILCNLSMTGHTPKLIVSVWGSIWHLSTGKKSTSSSMLFWRLVDSILAHKSRTRILPNMGLVVKYQQQY